MFSLRSISLFALACTAIASAAPTVNVARQIPVPLGSIDGQLSPVDRGEPHKSFPDIFNGAHTGLGPIIANLG